MIWWDWTWPQRVALLTAYVGIAALPGALAMITGSWPLDWRALLGSSAFLFIPLLLGTMLFVGLRTGKMPSRGQPVIRATSPFWFWMTGALYGVALAAYFGLVMLVVVDAASG